jgi:enterochelin esterase-like enzyme
MGEEKGGGDARCHGQMEIWAKFAKEEKMKKLMLILTLLGMSVPIRANAQAYALDSMYSNSLGFMRYMRVCLPAGYDTSTMHYPVIYFLHGAGGNHNSYHEIYIIVNNLMNSHVIEPVIVVMPDGSIDPYGGSCYTNSELYGAFEDFIVYDLIEYIDTTYRTIPTRNKRCIMGHSMGGSGSFKLALKHPDVYRGLASHSGTVDLNICAALWIPHILEENAPGPPYNYTPDAGTFTLFTFTIAGALSPDTTDPPYFVDFPLDSMGFVDSTVWALWQPHDIPRLAAQLPPDTNLAIYFDCGTSDQYECYPQHPALAESLDLLGIAYEFQSYAGDHTNMLWQRFPIAITFLDSVMQTGIEEEAGYATTDERYTLTISPNPFSTLTTISLSIEQSAKSIEMKIYDASGRLVRDLYCALPHAPCAMQISWDGTDQADRQLPSGVYFVKLKSDDYEETEKVLLVR